MIISLILFFHRFSRFSFRNTPQKRRWHQTSHICQQSMNKISVCLILNPQISQWSRGTFIPRGHSTRFFQFRHIGCYIHGLDRQNIDLRRVFHLDRLWEEPVERLCSRVHWQVRNRVLSSYWGNVYDGSSFLPLQHFWNHHMAHHHHGHRVDIDLIEESFTGYLMQIADIGNPNVIYQNAYVQTIQTFFDILVKSFFLGICKVSHYTHSFNILIELFQALSSFFHLFVVPRHDANIKSLLSQFLRKP